MSYALPQEVKRSKKFTSLPDDLSKIAEELIKDKFREEVAVDNCDPFLHNGGCGDLQCTTCYDSRRYELLHRSFNNPRSDYNYATMVYRTDRINLGSLYELYKRLKMEGFHDKGATWRMDRDSLRMLLSDPRFSSCGYRTSNSMTIFGINVEIIPPNNGMYVELIMTRK